MQGGPGQKNCKKWMPGNYATTWRHVKRFLLSLIAPFLVLTLSCCNGKATPVDEKAISEIFTAAAMTIEAQITPTAWPDTDTPEMTSTLLPTAIPGTPLATSTSESLAALSSSTCDSSAYVSDVSIPDGTELYPDQEFTKTWTLKNTGTCTWTASYELTFYSGNKMSGSAIAIDESVAPGSEVQVSVSMTAPSTTGTYTGYWRLANGSGSAFGESIYVEIVVTEDASTLTPTITTTPTSTTASSTSTSTPAVTPTPTTASSPTSTRIATEIPTSTAVPTDPPIPTDTSAPTAVPADTSSP